MLVYVLNKHGKALMPCSCRKARLLLKEKKAKVVKRTPFTIQLLYGSSGYRQPITLGVDAGSKVVGVSASTNKQELFNGECHLRNDIVRLLSTRRELRITRRSQKTRYRKPRFSNRVSTKKSGWIAPSTLNKIQTHEKVISNLHKLLPITKVVVEVGSFDIHKIKNPHISSKEYQQGEQMDFWNTREYVLYRDGHKCKSCSGKSGDKVLQVHHIESRKTGGNAPNNLITLCSTCHKKYHNGELKLKLKRGTALRDAAFMNIMKNKLLQNLQNDYPNVLQTYGYITKNTRITHGIDKTHSKDAFCIAGNTSAIPIDNTFVMRKVRSHSRSLHKQNLGKGGKLIKTYGERVIHGFRNFDVVKVGDVVGFITTRRQKGCFAISNTLGNKLIECSKKNIVFIQSSNNILIEVIKTN